MTLIVDSLRDVALAHEASIRMSGDRRLDLVDTVLIGFLLLAKFVEVPPPLPLMVCLVRHDALVLVTSEEDGLAQRNALPV